jgi:hypothetical protein
VRKLNTILEILFCLKAAVIPAIIIIFAKITEDKFLLGHVLPNLNSFMNTDWNSSRELPLAAESF